MLCQAPTQDMGKRSSGRLTRRSKGGKDPKGTLLFGRPAFGMVGYHLEFTNHMMGQHTRHKVDISRKGVIIESAPQS